jgi:hypothetical protein
MSTPVNYYLYIARGKEGVGNVTASASTGGTNGDIELRMQIDNGTTTTGLTKLDAIKAMEWFEAFISSNGLPSGSPGTNLPKL